MVKEVVFNDISHIKNPNKNRTTFCGVVYEDLETELILSAKSIEDLETNYFELCSECKKKAKEFEYPKEKLNQNS